MNTLLHRLTFSDDLYSGRTGIVDSMLPDNVDSMEKKIVHVAVHGVYSAMGLI